MDEEEAFVKDIFRKVESSSSESENEEEPQPERRGILDHLIEIGHIKAPEAGIQIPRKDQFRKIEDHMLVGGRRDALMSNNMDDQADKLSEQKEFLLGVMAQIKRDLVPEPTDVRSFIKAFKEIAIKHMRQKENTRLIPVGKDLYMMAGMMLGLYRADEEFRDKWKQREGFEMHNFHQEAENIIIDEKAQELDRRMAEKRKRADEDEDERKKLEEEERRREEDEMDAQAEEEYNRMIEQQMFDQVRYWSLLFNAWEPEDAEEQCKKEARERRIEAQKEIQPVSSPPRSENGDDNYREVDMDLIQSDHEDERRDDLAPSSYPEEAALTPAAVAAMAEETVRARREHGLADEPDNSELVYDGWGSRTPRYEPDYEPHFGYDWERGTYYGYERHYNGPSGYDPERGTYSGFERPQDQAHRYDQQREPYYEPQYDETSGYDRERGTYYGYERPQDDINRYDQQRGANYGHPHDEAHRYDQQPGAYYGAPEGAAAQPSYSRGALEVAHHHRGAGDEEPPTRQTETPPLPWVYRGDEEMARLYADYGWELPAGYGTNGVDYGTQGADYGIDGAQPPPVPPPSHGLAPLPIAPPPPPAMSATVGWEYGTEGAQPVPPPSHGLAPPPAPVPDRYQREEYGTERIDYWAERADYGTDRVEYGMNGADYGTERAEYGVHGADYGTERVDYWAARADYGNDRWEEYPNEDAEADYHNEDVDEWRRTFGDAVDERADRREDSRDRQAHYEDAVDDRDDHREDSRDRQAHYVAPNEVYDVEDDVVDERRTETVFDRRGETQGTRPDYCAISEKIAAERERKKEARLAREEEEKRKRKEREEEEKKRRLLEIQQREPELRARLERNKKEREERKKEQERLHREKLEMRERAMRAAKQGPRPVPPPPPPQPQTRAQPPQDPRLQRKQLQQPQPKPKPSVTPAARLAQQQPQPVPPSVPSSAAGAAEKQPQPVPPPPHGRAPPPVSPPAARAAQKQQPAPPPHDRAPRPVPPPAARPAQRQQSQHAPLPSHARAPPPAATPAELQQPAAGFYRHSDFAPSAPQRSPMVPGQRCSRSPARSQQPQHRVRTLSQDQSEERREMQRRGAEETMDVDDAHHMLFDDVEMLSDDEEQRARIAHNATRFEAERMAHAPDAAARRREYEAEIMMKRQQRLDALAPDFTEKYKHRLTMKDLFDMTEERRESEQRKSMIKMPWTRLDFDCGQLREGDPTADFVDIDKGQPFKFSEKPQRVDFGVRPPPHVKPIMKVKRIGVPALLTDMHADKLNFDPTNEKDREQRRKLVELQRSRMCNPRKKVTFRDWRDLQHTMRLYIMSAQQKPACKVNNATLDHTDNGVDSFFKDHHMSRMKQMLTKTVVVNKNMNTYGHRYKDEFASIAYRTCAGSCTQIEPYRKDRFTEYRQSPLAMPVEADIDTIFSRENARMQPGDERKENFKEFEVAHREYKIIRAIRLMEDWRIEEIWLPELRLYLKNAFSFELCRELRRSPCNAGLTHLVFTDSLLDRVNTVRFPQTYFAIHQKPLTLSSSFRVLCNEIPYEKLLDIEWFIFAYGFDEVFFMGQNPRVVAMRVVQHVMAIEKLYFDASCHLRHTHRGARESAKFRIFKLPKHGMDKRFKPWINEFNAQLDECQQRFQNTINRVQKTAYRPLHYKVLEWESEEILKQTMRKGQEEYREMKREVDGIVRQEMREKGERRRRLADWPERYRYNCVDSFAYSAQMQCMMRSARPTKSSDIRNWQYKRVKCTVPGLSEEEYDRIY